jgi:hypothetical protein
VKISFGKLSIDFGDSLMLLSEMNDNLSVLVVLSSVIGESNC